jgi:hypothetical protein
MDIIEDIKMEKEIIVYAWHPSAYKPIDDAIGSYGFWYPEHPSSFVTSFESLYFANIGIYGLADLVALLNERGLNIIVPKEYKEKHMIYADTRLFTQR